MAKLKEEFFKILPPTIYFFVALHLVMFIRVLMLSGRPERGRPLPLAKQIRPVRLEKMEDDAGGRERAARLHHQTA